MEATHATDCGQWRTIVDPGAAAACATAIEGLSSLPVLDASVQRVIALCDDPDATTNDIVTALEGDASFSANLLRFANSAARAVPIRAKTIRQAVMLVGRISLRRLAIETATFRFLERARGNGGAACGQLHLHAIAVALCATATAERVRLPVDDLHLAALLHDVGKLVLPEAFGSDACDEIANSHPNGGDRVWAEREAFGIDHAQAGALLCDAWKLPSAVADTVAWHHGGPSGIAVPTVGIACVQLADAVANAASGGQLDHALVEAALDLTGLDATALDELAARTVPDAPRPGELGRKVTDLERLASDDDLTGLHNRRSWLQTVRTEMAAIGGGSIVLLDVDGLKQINVRHGSSVGDLVLTEVARLLPPHGIAGRLGGDELALYVHGSAPEAELTAADVVQSVADAFAELGGSISVSAGVAGHPYVGPNLAAAVEAAEGALHSAKRAGGGAVVAAGSWRQAA